MRFRFLIVIILLSFQFACKPSDAQLVQKAEQEALSQRSQLARHLFEHVISTHSTKDETRFRALKGFSYLSLNQLRDYILAVRLVDKMGEEFGSSISHQQELRDLRFFAASAARLQLQKPETALRLITPYLDQSNLTELELQEIGRTHLALLEFEKAEAAFSKAWKIAGDKKNCFVAKENQLDLMQVKTLMKNCPETIETGKQKLFNGCEPDTYSVQLEMAHCYEYEGEPNKAVAIYEEMLKKSPENSRIQILISNVRKREKERQLK